MSLGAARGVYFGVHQFSCAPEEEQDASQDCSSQLIVTLVPLPGDEHDCDTDAELVSSRSIGVIVDGNERLSVALHMKRV